MWDPARRSTLDRPAYGSHDKSQRQEDAARAMTYWIDSRGVKHYYQQQSAPAAPPPPANSPP